MDDAFGTQTLAEQHEQRWASLLAAAPPEMLAKAIQMRERAGNAVAEAQLALDPPSVQTFAPILTNPAVGFAPTPHPAEADAPHQLEPLNVDVLTRIACECDNGLSIDNDDDDNDDSPTNTNGADPKNPAAGDVLRWQDRFLPIANIAKLMARQLAHLGYAKISQDAKSLMQESVTEFICFIMSEANDRAANLGRKTVAGEDIIYALRDMGAPLANPHPRVVPSLTPRSRS